MRWCFHNFKIFSSHNFTLYFYIFFFFCCCTPLLLLLVVSVSHHHVENGFPEREHFEGKWISIHSRHSWLHTPISDEYMKHNKTKLLFYRSKNRNYFLNIFLYVTSFACYSCKWNGSDLGPRVTLLNVSVFIITKYPVTALNLRAWKRFILFFAHFPCHI